MIYSCRQAALASGKTLAKPYGCMLLISISSVHHFLCSLYPCKFLPLAWRKRSILFHKITFYVVFNVSVWI